MVIISDHPSVRPSKASRLQELFAVFLHQAKELQKEQRELFDRARRQDEAKLITDIKDSLKKT